MPKLSFVPKEVTVSGRAIPEELVEEYKKLVKQVHAEKAQDGLLEFGKDENISLGRRALKEAAVRLKKYVRVQKLRGEDNKLKVVGITAAG